MGGRLLWLSREPGSQLGKLVVSGDGPGVLVESGAMPWAEVIRNAVLLAGAGAQVEVRVFARRRGSYGYEVGQVNSYPVQLPRERRERGPGGSA